MAINIPLPKPGEGIDSASEMLARLMNAKYQTGVVQNQQAEQKRLAQLQPYEIALKQAQAKAENVKADQLQALINLLQGGSPGNIGTTETPSTISGTTGTIGTEKTNEPVIKPSQNKMSVNQAMLAMGALGLPTPPVVNGQIVTPFGTFQVGETKAETRAGEAKKESAAAALKSTSENVMANAPLNASFDALEEMFNDPSYKNIAGTFEGKIINAQPLGIPLGAWLQHNLPSKFSPKDAELAGSASAHMGAIVTNVAAKFKGPFKEMVGGLINNMKPNMGDSLEVQKGKITALKQLSEFADQVNGSIAKDVSAGMDPTAATLKAAKEFPMSKIIKKTESVINKLAQKNMITIVDSNGKEHEIHESNLDEAKKRDPGLKVKK